MLALLTQLAVAACLKPSSVTEIDARLDEAERAWAGLEPEAFSTAIDDAVLLLPCLAEVAPPTFAARYHRLLALRTWGTGDVERASWSMLAARTLDPTYAFPDEVLAPDHELRKAYETITPALGPTRRPARPRGGSMTFDGLGPDEPLDRTTIAQLTDANGQLQTRLLRPGDPLPPYIPVPRTRNAVLAGSSVFLATGLAFYGAAWATHDDFYAGTPDQRVRDLERIASRSQVFTGLAVTGIALGAAGVGAAFAFGSP
jgi:hypothetical protein